MSCNIDFHTHSVASPDGSLNVAHYEKMLSGGPLDMVAVTDHNTITFAKKLHDLLGETVIIGEEISAREGEIIGLYLQAVVPADLSAAETVQRIKAQGGLVYIPHPLETVRKGLPLKVLDTIGNDIDVIEGYNGRAVFQNRSVQTLAWAKTHNIPVAAASDAHGRAGWGSTYTRLADLPTRETLLGLLQNADYASRFPGIRAILYPKLNKGRSYLRTPKKGINKGKV